MEAQFIAINGLSFRLELLWTDWANNSFPVPLWPYINRAESERAIFPAVSFKVMMLSLLPTISSNEYLAA